ncbi:MAG: fibronectin type III domain-containing protein [Clostridia bacterium]|nr:fibronectin type III domain-containing protein [Clostridia bacterium]
MKNRRKIIYCILYTVMIICVALSVHMTSAAVSYESENNGEAYCADVILLNNTVYGEISNSSEEDWYRFTLTQNSAVDISFTHEQYRNGDWRVTVYRQEKDGNEELAYNDVKCKEGDYSFPSLGLPSGNYFIRVSGDGSSKGLGYGITVNAYAISSRETEFNDEAYMADIVALGGAIKGNLTKRITSEDIDWYKFNVTNDSKTDIKFTHEKTDDGGYWTVYIYRNENGTDFTELASRKIKGTDGDYSFASLGLGKGEYFVKILCSTDWLRGLEYGISIKNTLTSDWETEFNDEYFQADTLTPGITKNGNITDRVTTGDEDWYEFEIKTDSNVNISFKHEKSNQSAYWSVYVYKFDAEADSYKQLSKASVKANSGTYTFSSLGLSKGKYLISVDSSSDSLCAVNYGITVKINLNKVSGVKVSANKTTSFEVKWSKVKGAESYEVYYSTDGKKWSCVKTSKNKATVKGLKPGIKYKVKIRAVAGACKGSCSSVLSTATKPATVSLSKVTAGKNQLTANWKTVSGATGYEVYYSTSKDFTKKTTKNVTVKSSKTKKLTVKKLKKGKKYFVRVRAYKTVSGKNIYSSWSKVKNVKIK